MVSTLAVSYSQFTAMLQADGVMHVLCILSADSYCLLITEIEDTRHIFFQLAMAGFKYSFLKRKYIQSILYTRLGKNGDIIKKYNVMMYSVRVLDVNIVHFTG